MMIVFVLEYSTPNVLRTRTVQYMNDPYFFRMFGNK